MKFFETIDMLNHLHFLIKAEKTGRPQKLSERLGISRATLYNIIDELKIMDAPIKYSRYRETFYYSSPYEFRASYTIETVEKQSELKKITGGFNIFSSVHFFRRKDNKFTLVS